LKEKRAMDEKQSQENVSRRKALKIIVGSAGAAVSLPVLGGARPPGATPLCHMARAATQASAAPYAAKFFNPKQIETLDALTETLVPTDEHSPGAEAALVWQYIDEIIADAGSQTKSLWTEGLAALDKLAGQESGKKFAECAADQQFALVEKISRNEEDPKTLEERFFVAAKRATIDGYYTSFIGIHKDLEYQGNTALAEFPGCTHPEHQA